MSNPQISPIWKPLHGPTSIRLLTLYPGRFQDHVEASLEEYDLRKDPYYEAISYYWGRQMPEYNITVNGQVLQVRKNLYDFLRKLRSGSQNRILWVDAICISQMDLEEKSQQVRNIHHVFLQASCVHAWLGEHQNSSEVLFDPQEDDWQPHEGLFRKAWRLTFSPTPLRKLYDARRRRARIWIAFFERPYFSRRWIVQELVLARSIMVHCGTDERSWDELIGSRVNHQNFNGINFGISGDIYNPANKPFRKATNNIRMLLMLRGEARTQKFERDIFTLINMFSHTKCEDPLDQVYALLSLDDSSMSSQQDMQHYTAKRTGVIFPDYQKDMADLFITVFTKRNCTDPIQLEPSLVNTENARRRSQISGRVRWNVDQVLVELGSQRALTAYHLLADLHLDEFEMKIVQERFREAALKDHTGRLTAALSDTEKAIRFINRQRASYQI
ncbi:uncharacterized protein A1O5_00703 [Cladophialophora psammophila CBS 110553]|uniref:Heterokaryon incompatibility domain-containing protein n=1 Tax=Cladophialophora psammophila CBS 110553 TaxID=1182543 RepID=W9XFS5_9EURO|nr:uncharacterized protein A1O5_00703 [Cladophialophora psammophila CBS 110553]EXJ76195.1 hypothetical protein A1O5_00703 [Cladophialophora psammophila CBS 110553]